MNDDALNLKQCALAIGIPVTREQFLADCGDPRKDFAPSRLRFGYSSEVFWNAYQGFNNEILAAADELERSGGTVVRVASLDRLSELLQSHQVVTLLTHHVFQPVTPGDILNHSAIRERILRAVSEPHHIAVTAVDLYLARKVTIAKIDSVNGLATEIDAAIAPVHHWYETTAHAGLDTASAVQELAHMVPVDGPARGQLEQAYLGHLRPAPCIELADGLCTIPALVSAMPSEFSGILDLTLCNSLVPAEVIKQHRPHCRIACVRSLASALSRAVIYRHVLRQIRSQSQSYLKALVYAHLALLQAIQGT